MKLNTKTERCGHIPFGFPVQMVLLNSLCGNGFSTALGESEKGFEEGGSGKRMPKQGEIPRRTRLRRRARAPILARSAVVLPDQRSVKKSYKIQLPRLATSRTNSLQTKRAFRLYSVCFEQKKRKDTDAPGVVHQIRVYSKRCKAKIVSEGV
ncbi:hypothetical protein CC1G_10798 [Coprinopsis cinerea okayama7|uniref:Uncharacterized protein n=1 Tax=Coprinopsis cinerea (strain Okayama-7 / 130 / ATCC MYA-4618 / FGSC 9003) TaxID=240176 RepID=A8NMI6_COPC7|nr:hypothetical protein CC1G_10798 [Coprinopsis cinerea okayama7\|eukprot:XP_001834924.2 hypothetical protein CC1G_10798 [Coprinopsis cinerea okayama7\